MTVVTSNLKSMSVNWLKEYCIPPKSPDKFDSNRLRVISIIGFMESGKTTLANWLMAQNERSVKYRYDVGILNISGKTIVDIFGFLQDNHDLVNDVHYVQLFVDDVFFQGLAYEYTEPARRAIKFYANIRHEFESLGMRNGVIVLMFAGQRYRLIPPFFRNTPFLIFKSIVTQDEREKRMVLDALSRYNKDSEAFEYYQFLLELSDKALTKWQDHLKSYSVVKHFRRGCFILKSGIDRPRNLITIPLGYDNEKIKQKEIDLANIFKFSLLLTRNWRKGRPPGYKTIAKLIRDVFGLKFGSSEGFRIYQDVFRSIYGGTPKELRTGTEVKSSCSRA